MSEEPDRKQSEKLTFETFKKCPFKENSFAKTDQQGYIILLVCKNYCGSSACIRNKAKLREIKKGLVDMGNYADGGTSVYLAANFEKH